MSIILAKIEQTSSQTSLKLQYLNQLKKDNKEQRRFQNKRYREKHRDIINLKK